MWRRTAILSGVVSVALMLMAGGGCEGRIADESAVIEAATSNKTSAPDSFEVESAPVIEPELESPELPDAAMNSAIFDRVVVIGASATCGFGVETDIQGPFGPTTAAADLATAVQAVLMVDRPVEKQCSFLFFNDPMGIGPLLMANALACEPTIVFGLDYLFWYGYGHRNVTGGRIADEADRLELLEAGLKQLELCQCPVVVGDYPDMRAAIGLMLSEAQVPRPETLVLLNNRLREWAKDRPNVIIVPLSEIAGETNGDESAARKYLQRDQLHPTAEGLILMAERAADAVVNAEIGVTNESFERDEEKALARLKAALEGRGK